MFTHGGPVRAAAVKSYFRRRWKKATALDHENILQSLGNFPGQQVRQGGKPGLALFLDSLPVFLFYPGNGDYNLIRCASGALNKRC